MSGTWKALAPVVVAGKPVSAGATFSATEAAVESALARGLVTAVAPKRKAR